jgi:hypothetical protein
LVSWPHPSTGFTLHKNGALGTTNRVNVTDSAAQIGQQWQLIVPPVAGNNFYRLLK